MARTSSGSGAYCSSIESVASVRSPRGLTEATLPTFTPEIRTSEFLVSWLALVNSARTSYCLGFNGRTPPTLRQTNSVSITELKMNRNAHASVPREGSRVIIRRPPGTVFRAGSGTAR